MTIFLYLLAAFEGVFLYGAFSLLLMLLACWIDLVLADEVEGYKPKLVSWAPEGQPF